MFNAKNLRLKAYLLILLILILVIVGDDVNAQCVMCRATAGSSEGDAAQKFGEGLNTGILYLMAVPYVILIGGGVYFFKNKKKDD